MLRQSLMAVFSALEIWQKLETEPRSISQREIYSIWRELDGIGPWANLIARPLMQPLLLFQMKERRDQ